MPERNGVRRRADRRGLRPALPTGIVLVAVAWLACPIARAGIPLAGEWLTVSATADIGPYPGALFSVDIDHNAVRVINYPQGLTGPSAVGWEGHKLVYVANNDQLLVYDPYRGATDPPRVIASGYFNRISDIERDGRGGFYVLDRRSDPLGEGGHGALFHLDPGSGDVHLISGDFRFGDPVGLFLEEDGRLLILDPLGKPQAGAERLPTLFRLDPASGAMETLTTLPFAVSPADLVKIDGDTLLVVDSDVFILGFKSGAVWKLAPGTFAPVDTIANLAFVRPTDLGVDPQGRLVVLDSRANPASYPGSSGALFRFDPHTGELLDTSQSSLFKDIVGLVQLGGAEIANSSVELVDEDPPLIAGDRVRLEALLVNTGLEATEDLVLEAQFGTFICSAGDVEVDRGEISFDVLKNSLTWDPTLAPGDSVHLTAHVQVPWSAEFGSWLRLPVRVESKTSDFSEGVVQRVVKISEPGDRIYTDAGLTYPAPRLFRIDDEGQPVTFELEHPESLGTPSDAIFDEQGYLYVLDGTLNQCRVLKIEPMHGTIEVLHRGAPLTHARGMCLANDGALLIADPHLPRPFTTGAVYRFDPVTREMTEFFSHPQVTDPVDVCHDRLGHYLITDYTSDINGDDSALIEVDAVGGIVAVYSSPFLRDPLNATVAPNGSIYLCDIGFRDDPSPWMIARIERGADTPRFFAMAITSPQPFRLPYGIEALSTSELIISERDKNPLYGGRIGSIVRGALDQGIWDFYYSSFDISLVDPERVAVFRTPQPFCANLLLDDTSAGQLVPGDTLIALARLNNSSPLPSRNCVARIYSSYPLRLIDASADRGDVVVDSINTAVQWTGDVLFLDPLEVSARFVVDPLAGYGEQAEIIVDVPGTQAEPVRGFRTVRAPIRGGDCLVLDSRSDPFGDGHRGAVYLADREEDVLIPLVSHPSLVAPVDFMAISPDRILILDREADPWMSGQRPGALFSLDISSRRLNLLTTSLAFMDPARLRRHPSGRLLILDPSAQPSPTGGVGAIFSTPPNGGAPDTVSCSRAFRELHDICVDANGVIWVTDGVANPLHLPTDDTGAIFAIDYETGAVIDTIAGIDFVTPAGIECLSDGTLLVTDLGWTGPYGTFGIRRLNPVTRSMTTVLNSAYLSTPARFAVSPAGEILVIDQNGWYPGIVGNDGMIFALNLTPPTLGVAAPGLDGMRLESVGWVPRPHLVVRRMETPEDLPYIAPSDTLECFVEMANESPSDEPLGRLEIDIPPPLQLDPFSIEATPGSASPHDTRLIWEGTLAAGDSVQVHYHATAHPAPTLTAWGTQCAQTSGLLAEGSTRCMEHYISSAIGPGELLIVDSWADPRSLERAGGAVFRIDGATREATPILADSQMVSPTAIAILPGSRTDLLILDSDAVVDGHYGQGALFRASTRTGRMEMVFSDTSWIQPTAFALLDSTTCFVMDEIADPLDLLSGGGFGPGAIFRIDLRNRTGSVFFSDTVTTRPLDLDVDPLTGALYIIDRGVSSPMHYASRIIRIEPSGQGYTILHEGQPLLSPRCLMRTEDGNLLIADPYPLGGMLFQMTPQGNVSPYIVCNALVSPTDILMGPRQRPLVVDAQADPLDFGGSMGSVLRFFPDGQVKHCSLYRTGPPFMRPRGGAIHFEGASPVELVTLEIAETHFGIELRWRGPAELNGADYFVYRREASGEDEGDEDYECLNRDLPVQGAGDLTYVDPRIDAGAVYEYLLVALARDGTRYEFGPYSIRVEGGGDGFALDRISPNPLTIGSGEAVTIRYRVPTPGGDVRLAVFDVAGRRLRDLVRESRRPGTHLVLWNGRDEEGRRIASGLYWLRLQAGHREVSRRLLLVR